MKKHKQNISKNTNMKRVILFCAIMAGAITGVAEQPVVENFNVGPYVVDYKGPDDFKYRLLDNIDLYDFFELQRDTTIISMATEVPVKHAIEIAGYIGTSPYVPKEIGLEGVWKQHVGKNFYFNGGLSLTFGWTKHDRQTTKRSMVEIGVPLQIEYGKLNHQYASLYGSFGLTPAVYSTMQVESKDGSGKKSGLYVAPSLEFGGNIPVGSVIMRIGVYGRYKLNCTAGDYDVYKQSAGRAFLGAKIGVVL